MHIALVIPSLDKIAGAESQVLLLAEGLHRRGRRVSVVALSGTGAGAAHRLTTGGIRFHSLGMRRGLADPGGWLRFSRWLHRERPDIVHTHLPHATWLARWSRLGAPIPYLIDTIHSTATGGAGRRIGYRISDWLSDRVTAVSHAAAHSHSVAGMVASDKLEVLPNGIRIEPASHDPAEREATRHGIGIGDEFLWMAAGRLDPVKDYESLLRALALLPEHAHLAVAGDGRLAGELRSRAIGLGLGNRVRFLGYQDDPRRLMRAADAYVLSSLWEGLPVALIEAAGCGLAAVVTDVAGTREAVIPGETAWLVPPSSPEALAKAMQGLMQLPAEVRASMGDRARRHAMERFHIELVLNRWETLYSRRGRKTIATGAFSPAGAASSRQSGVSRQD